MFDLFFFLSPAPEAERVIPSGAGARACPERSEGDLLFGSIVSQILRYVCYQKQVLRSARLRRASLRMTTLRFF